MGGWGFLMATLLLGFGCAGLLPAQSTPASVSALGNTPRERAQAAYLSAQTLYLRAPAETTNLVTFIRETFNRAEFSTNDTERAALAKQGIEAARVLVAREPQSVAGHYFLGMNLGQLARTKSLGALRIVDEMEREFKAAASGDEKFAHAGPVRNLALLYHEAPAFGSIGSRTKARKFFERAVALVPDYPENRLNLAEAYLKWREKALFAQELAALEALWPAAKTNFSGPDWEAAWVDWDARLQKLRGH